MSDSPPPIPPVPPTGPSNPPSPPTDPPSPPTDPQNPSVDRSVPPTDPQSPPTGQSSGNVPAGGDGAASPYGGEPPRFPPPESSSGYSPSDARAGFGTPSAPGYGRPNQPPSDHSQSGYSQSGYPQPGSTQSGYQQAGHPRPGYQQAGHPQAGYPQPGYTQPGHTQPYNATANPSGPKRGLAIAALIVGGVSILFALIPFLSYVAIITAIVGLVLGIAALRQTRGSRGIALAGLITSAAALLLALVLSVVYTNVFITAIEELETSASPVFPDDSFGDDPSDDPFDDGTGGTGGTDDSATGLGSRDQPDAIGATVQFFDLDDAPAWEIAPGAPTLDANSVVAADEYNDPPPPGTQYAILPLTITYVGTETGLPYEVEVQFVAADGTSYDTDDVYAVIPEDLYDINELFPGGSATGNVVIPIPTDAIEGGAWAVSTSYSGPYFFEAE